MIRIRTIAELLEDFGPVHLVQKWDELASELQRRLVDQIERIDFELLQDQIDALQSQTSDHRARASRAQAPRNLVKIPRTEDERARSQRAYQLGEEVLRRGQVGAILVAGGQGTRLGFDLPKGMYPIGPVSQASLFQGFCEQLLARGRRGGVRIPYYVMTSDATYSKTIEFFEQNNFFGLNEEDVKFFQQGNMPAIDAGTGRLLLSGPAEFAMNPDGHGGLLQALDQSGMLQDMASRGIEYLHYHQVDNPHTIVCDPTFIGLHVEAEAEISTKVVRKKDYAERMGVFVELEGQTQIIEYSDLPDEVAKRTTADGELEFWAGSTAIHVFSRRFFQRLIDDRITLPFHVAFKQVPYLNDRGEMVQPEKPNAYKFERFVFDVLFSTDRALIVETERTREFNPVKNASGEYSPDSVRKSLSAMYASWLRKAGMQVPEQAVVEICPLSAVSEEECLERIQQAPSLTDRWHWREERT